VPCQDKKLVLPAESETFVKRILCIDGGGIRGIIPTLILNKIESFTGQPIWRLFDLIAGTSVGGLTALGLTMPTPLTTSQMISFYRIKGSTIFQYPWWRPIKNMGDLLGSKYGDSLIQPMEDMFGSIKLSQAMTEVLIPSFDMKSYSPFFFKRHQALADPANDFNMRDVAVATASAPTYFQAHPLGEQTLIDGGIFANCPCTPALAEAMRLFPNESFCMVSVGTGKSQPKFPDVGDWGIVQWARPLVDTLMDASVDAEVYKMKQFLPDSFIRLQPDLTAIEAIMDDPSHNHLDALISETSNFIQMNSDLMKRVFQLLEV
jgi:uncharacterized protein